MLPVSSILSYRVKFVQIPGTDNFHTNFFDLLTGFNNDCHFVRVKFLLEV